LAQSLREINRYPDREFTNLRSSLAAYLGNSLSEENLWAANGSNEVLQQIFMAFGGPGRKALTFSPTYSMYSLIAQSTDTQYIEEARDSRYELSVDSVVSAIKKHNPDIVLICSPNNPTGTPVELAVIEAAYAATNGILVIDEAYAEFSLNENSALSLLKGRERLLISRTMSKAFSFAGARVGYLAADAAVCDAMRLVRLPYHLSALTQAAAEAALSHSARMLATVADIRDQRDRLYVALQDIGLDPYRSDANFILVGGIANPNETWQALLDRGILVRNVGIPNTLRITAGTEAETTAVIEAITEILS
ncbi:MAG: histidinol-phosphate transaminase, partial [Actinobacteria bacterium]|nr:histidinol-phosphate transaminase [Actinomycetota bacterium]